MLTKLFFLTAEENDDSLLIQTSSDGGSKDIDVNEDTVIALLLFPESKPETIATG